VAYNCLFSSLGRVFGSQVRKDKKLLRTATLDTCTYATAPRWTWPEEYDNAGQPQRTVLQYQKSDTVPASYDELAHGWRKLKPVAVCCYYDVGKGRGTTYQLSTSQLSTSCRRHLEAEDKKEPLSVCVFLDRAFQRRHARYACCRRRRIPAGIERPFLGDGMHAGTTYCTNRFCSSFT
jgi:hypothetical protein